MAKIKILLRDFFQSWINPNGKLHIKHQAAHWSLWIVLGVFLSLLILPTSAFAEELDLPDDLFSAEEEALFQDIPSVYSASKYEQKITEAPSSISIVTAEEIKQYGYRTLADILMSLRGFFATNDRNYSYLGTRGFARPADYNTRVLLLVDGHRINEAVYDSATIGNDFVVDVDNIERVEVIRGPSSSLYGNNAFFGVINVWTKRGRDYQGVEVSGEYRTYDTYKTRLNYGNRFDNGIEMLLSGSYLDSQGKDDIFFKEFNDPSTNNGVAVKNDGEQVYNLFGEFSFQDFTLRGAYVHRKKEVPTAAFGTFFNNGRDKTTDAHGYVDLRYEHDFDNHTLVVGRLFYDNYYYNGDYIYDWNDPTPPPDLVVNNDKARAQWWGSELRMTKRLLGNHRVTVGGEFRHNFQQDQENFDDDQGGFKNLDDKYDSVNWGLFAQDDIQIFDSLALNLGVRYDHFPHFGGTVNPRVGLIYNPFSTTTFKLLYGTAFRAPSAYERFYHDGLVTTKPNKDLDPETIKTVEFIAEQGLGGSLRATASFFYNRINDVITFTIDPSDGLFVNENLQDVRTFGVETALEGKVFDTVDTRISYSWQDTEDRKTGRNLTNSPKHMVKGNLIAPLYQETLFGSVGTQYMSRRKTLDGNHTDDFFLTNLTLLSRFKNVNVFGEDWVKGIELSGTVYNLFDEEYGDPGSEEHVQDQIFQDGRTYRVKLTVEF